MSRYDELQKLQSLKDTGAISEEEYAREKQRIFDTPEVSLTPPPPPPAAGYTSSYDVEAKPWGMDRKLFCMLLHLSQFAGYIIWGAGFALPIIMWATNKDKFPEVDEHGRVVFNWMLSAFIYGVICFILTFIFIGILGFLVLGILAIVFPIIGAIKANEGTVWRYPFSIRFFG